MGKKQLFPPELILAKLSLCKWISQGCRGGAAVGGQRTRAPASERRRDGVDRAGGEDGSAEARGRSRLGHPRGLSGDRDVQFWKASVVMASCRAKAIRTRSTLNSLPK